MSPRCTLLRQLEMRPAREPRLPPSRRTRMKIPLVCALLALTAACGGASGQQLSDGAPVSPSATPTVAQAVDGSPTAQPARSAAPAPSAPVLAAPRATAGHLNPTTAYPTARTATSGTVSSGTASSGPGHLSSPAASPSPRPTPSPVAGTVTVTDGDNGTTVRLVVGQHLRVRLSQGTWDPPGSSASSVVVRRSSSGGYPTDQPVDAAFDAVGGGAADVTAQSDAACFHTQPRCMMPTRQWQVHVTVS